MALVVAFDLESAAALEAFGGILNGMAKAISKMQGKVEAEMVVVVRLASLEGGLVVR